MEKERDCFKCAHYRTCFLHREFDGFLKKGSGILNINGDGAPGTINGIYEAVTNACIEFMPPQERDVYPVKKVEDGTK